MNATRYGFEAAGPAELHGEVAEAADADHRDPFVRLRIACPQHRP